MGVRVRFRLIVRVRVSVRSESMDLRMVFEALVEGLRHLVLRMVSGPLLEQMDNQRSVPKHSGDDQCSVPKLTAAHSQHTTAAKCSAAHSQHTTAS